MAIMIKDTSLSPNLSFAVLPIVLPINPRNGRIVKEIKKRTTNGANNPGDDIEIKKEISPQKRYIVKEKLNIFVLEKDKISSKNNSGYYLFTDLPQSKGYTLIIKSDNFISSKNFIDMQEFDFDRKNIVESETVEGDNAGKIVSADRSILAFIFEKYLLKNTSDGNLFINSIVTYPSKKTILKVIINKVNTKDFFDNYPKKPILNTNVSLKKILIENDDEHPSPNSVINSDFKSENEYIFSTLDDIPQLGSFEGSYDESDSSFIGKRKFLNFLNQNQGKFKLIILFADNPNKELSAELKIEKSMTTLINILIIEKP
jgi:hypothetical protein